MLSPRQHLKSLLARGSASALAVQETLPLSLVAAAAQGDHKAVAQWLATDGSVPRSVMPTPAYRPIGPVSLTTLRRVLHTDEYASHAMTSQIRYAIRVRTSSSG